MWAGWMRRWAIEDAFETAKNELAVGNGAADQQAPCP